MEEGGVWYFQIGCFVSSIAVCDDKCKNNTHTHSEGALHTQTDNRFHGKFFRFLGEGTEGFLLNLLLWQGNSAKEVSKRDEL